MPDRTRPLDFEVYEVTDVVGHGVGADSEQAFLPFYAAYSTDEEHRAHGVLHDAARAAAGVGGAAAARRALELHRQRGVPVAGRSAQAPFSGDLRQLSIQTLCTNRDLALQMPVGIGKTDFTLDVAAPVDAHPRGQRAEPAVRAAGRRRGRLARDQPPVAQLPVARRLDARRKGAAALRELLELYAPSGDASARKQIEGIRSVRVEPVVRRLPRRRASAARRARAPSMLAFGRGLEIAVEVDELAFEGGSAFLLGSVLEHYFARYVSINSFTETVAALAGPRRDQPMGATVGRETDAVAFFAALAEAPYRYDFYQTLRRLECLYDAEAALGPGAAPGRRAGAARPGSGAVVRAGAAGVVRAGAGGRPPRLQVRLFGLLGPNGPLPLHLTEYARERLRHAGDPTLSRFLDLFHHRFLALFYRAWAQAQPHVNRDRPDDDRFAGYRRRVRRHRAGGVPRSRRRARPGEVLPRRRADPPDAQRRRAARDPAALLPRAGARSSSSSATGCRSSARERTYLGRDAARARRRRRRRQPRLGSAAQVPHPARPAHARASTRAFLPGGDALAQAGGLGAAVSRTSSSSGTCGCCSKQDEVPPTAARRRPAARVDDVARSSSRRRRRRRPVPRMPKRSSVGREQQPS